MEQMSEGAQDPPASARRPGRPAVGRTEPLERDEILTRAMQIVQEDGLDALSMRRLADDLGVTPMAIYHHVADKPALLQGLIDMVWAEIAGSVPSDPDPMEAIVAVSLRIREVWLQYIELANLAVAVAEVDVMLFQVTMMGAAIFELAGFPDPALAHAAVQNFTMGWVLTIANRRTASVYFGRDPDVSLQEARRLFLAHEASPTLMGVLEGRFDEGADRHFEPALRALLAGLHRPRPA